VSRWPDVAGRQEGSVHVLPVRVYYEDTDAGGIVYHANYLKYCERARSDCLRVLGIHQAALDDVFFVVRRMACDFLKPARLDDLLEVETRMAGLSGARLDLDQRVMLNGNTLFKALVGLQAPRSGQILIHGLPLGHHQHCVAYIPQREEIDWRFPITVMDVVMMGRYGYTGWLKRPTPADKQAVWRALEQMGIAELANRSISELSGGQQQRVFLARALAQEPHILLMDEPFTGVDAPTQETTLAQLEQLHHKGITVLVSTHDLNMAAKYFEWVLLLNRRIIAFGSPEEVFTPAHIRQAFANQALLMDELMIVDECCPGHEHREVRK
jgi:tol-pal system-associated acyl-CoA thioesterase